MFCDNSWKKPQSCPILNTEEVHVWRINLDVTNGNIDNYFAILSDDERNRAYQFVFEKERINFITARGALRKIIAMYLNERPEKLEFVYGANGKPSLSSSCNTMSLKFNLTHSGEVALLAVTVLYDVGIDVERIRSNFPFLELANKHFSGTEYMALKSIEPKLRHEAFFICWTKKEAFVKAIGKGLTYPLDKLEVSLLPGSPGKLLSASVDHELNTRYSLYSFSPITDYISAIVVIGSCFSVLLWDW